MQNAEKYFVKYKGAGLTEAAKIILTEKLYENENSYNYNLSKEIIEEDINRDYEIIFLVHRKFGYTGVCIVDDVYYKSFDETRFLSKDIENIVNEKMKFLSCYIKEKYRRLGLGYLLLSRIDKDNVFAREGIYKSVSISFWKRNGINVFSFDTNTFI
ncbi:hypothetical protein [Anaerosinus massiliensis]|uniref:hypothetical protein n=1 Tax=Massilibacillus massiliensis TaxID=1806837 RepID=UPI000DA6063C|nr:hypothetical protein [Massilibacillus massiliensis]